MRFSNQLSDQVSDLRDDTATLLHDIGKVKDQLLRLGSDKTQDFSQELVSRLQANLDDFSSRLASKLPSKKASDRFFSRFSDAKSNAVSVFGRVDDNAHAQPYSWVTAAAVAGLAVGLYFAFRTPEK